MNPTFVIGLDGATFSVLDRLIAEDIMPNLAKLIQSGTRCILKSTVHPLTPPAWTTLITGVQPGTHGVYDFLKHKIHADGFYLTLNDFKSIKTETLWSRVSRNGGRVLALNYPLTAPPPSIDGIIVPGLLSWRHLRRNVHPPEAYQRLSNLEGFNVQDLSWDLENEKKALQNFPEEELESWTEFHIRRERQWLNLATHCLDREPFDFAAVVFDGVDKLQHGCWWLLDPEIAPTHPTPFERRIAKLCREYFQLVDDAIGQILKIGGPDARIFIVSDHGFGPSSRILRINKWLEENGYLKWREEEATGPQTSASLFTPLNWAQTTAYCPSPAGNGIYIRKSHHDQDGGVPPNEYMSFRQRLREKLLDINDPAGTGKVLADVIVREEAYPGPLSEQAPDLTLVLKDYGFVSVINSTPSVVARDRTIGTHHPDGVLIACGPGVRQGAKGAEQSIVDIAPTLLYSLGLPIPAEYEGSVIESLFTREQLAAVPIVEDEQLAPRSSESIEEVLEEFDEEGDQAVISRLRALGYVE